MTLQVVRLDSTSIYFWMLGVTLTLLGVAFTVLPDVAGTDLLALGSMFMIAGLVVPVVVGLGVTTHELWNSYRGAGGEGQ